MQPTVAQWQARLEHGDLTARELCEHYLSRIDAVAHLNAVVARDDSAALAAADAADERRRAGERGPLLGIPITVKDGLDVVGLPCRGGSLARQEMPSADAVVVARAKSAGAVVIAKTNLPELGLSYETDNKVIGRTVHPLDPTRTPGGSSGGEGALLGADASPLGIGTDGGGSIRVPSNFCGLFGLRPTAGRVPTTGVWPPGRAGSMVDLLCVGPMGHSAADIAALLTVIAGPDLVDPFVPPVLLRDWREVDVPGLRIGWYVEDPVASPTSDVAEAVTAATRVLAEIGATVVATTLPSAARRATELFFLATAADGGEGVFAAVGASPALHTEQFMNLIQRPPYGGSTSAVEYFAVQQAMFDLRADVRRWAADFDVIIAPVCAGQAPHHEQAPAGVPADRYLRYESFNYTHTYSIAGLPAAAVPTGTAHGLPVGVQVIGSAWREDVVLAVAAALERALGGFAPTAELLAASRRQSEVAH